MLVFCGFYVVIVSEIGLFSFNVVTWDMSYIKLY